MTQDSTSQRESVSPLQAARILGVCYETVRRQVASGNLESFRVGRAIRIRRSVLTRYIEVRREQT